MTTTEGLDAIRAFEPYIKYIIWITLLALILGWWVLRYLNSERIEDE